MINFIIVVVGMWVQFVFLFRREWLYDKEKFQWMLLVGIVMFLISYFVGGKTIAFLKIPVFALMIFFGLIDTFFPKGRHSW